MKVMRWRRLGATVAFLSLLAGSGTTELVDKCKERQVEIDANDNLPLADLKKMCEIPERDGKTWGGYPFCAYITRTMLANGMPSWDAKYVCENCAFELEGTATKMAVQPILIDYIGKEGKDGIIRQSYFDNLNHLFMRFEVHRGYRVTGISWPDATDPTLGKYIPAQQECDDNNECKWRTSRQDNTCMDDWEVRMKWSDLCLDDTITSSTGKNSYCSGAGGFKFSKNEEKKSPLYDENWRYVYQGRVQMDAEEDIYTKDAAGTVAEMFGTRTNHWQLPFGLVFPHVTMAMEDQLELTSILPPSSIIRSVSFGVHTVIASDGVSPVQLEVNFETEVNRPWRLTVDPNAAAADPTAKHFDVQVTGPSDKTAADFMNVQIESKVLDVHADHATYPAATNGCTPPALDPVAETNGPPPCYQKWTLTLSLAAKEPAGGFACNIDGPYEVAIGAYDRHNPGVRKTEKFTFHMHAPNLCPKLVTSADYPISPDVFGKNTFLSAGDVEMNPKLEGYRSSAMAVAAETFDEFSTIFMKAWVDPGNNLGDREVKKVTLKAVRVSDKCPGNSQPGTSQCPRPRPLVPIFEDGAANAQGMSVGIEEDAVSGTAVAFNFKLNKVAIYISELPDDKTVIEAHLELTYGDKRRRLVTTEMTLRKGIQINSHTASAMMATFPAGVWDDIPQGFLFALVGGLLLVAGLMFYKLQKRKDEMSYNPLIHCAEDEIGTADLERS